jgi:prepilin-type N-terminal cleavage/methylation domain-containing protein
MSKNFPFSISNFQLSVKGFTLISRALSFGKSRACKGFTLIELLIAVAIIGVIGSLFLNTFPAAQGRSRDTQRQAAIKQVQTSLEIFANRTNNVYPSYTTAGGVVIAAANICGASSLNISPCPTDPKGGTGCPTGTATACEFRYLSNGTGSGSSSATQYVMWSALERPAVNTSPFFVVCSNGKVGQTTTAPASSVCPL